MKNVLCFALVGLLGCASPASPLPEGDRSASGTGPAEFILPGAPGPLQGQFTLAIGPEGEERYTFTARTSTGPTTLSGRFELSDTALAPYRSAEGEIETSYQGAGEFDWIFDNLGSIHVTWGLSDNGVFHEYMLSAVQVRIDATGLLEAELRGVALTRIDAANRRILPGDDLVITVRGRATGGCITRLRPGDPASPIVGDPTNSAPRCQELLSGL
jgi:hypothetical protein